MASQPQQVSLRASCAHCGCPIAVVYETATNRDTLLQAEYRCPLCHKLNPLKIPGRVVSVTDRPSK